MHFEILEQARSGVGLDYRAFTSTLQQYAIKSGGRYVLDNRLKLVLYIFPNSSDKLR